MKMKKLIFTITFTFTLLTVGQAQFDIDNLFGGANIGYAKPLGAFSDYAKGGLTYNAVIGYKITENFSAGVEYSSAITAAIDTSLTTGILGVNIYGLTGYYAKAWYKFKEGTFQPYASVALGVANFEEPEITSGTSTIKGANRLGFGANAELGFTIKNFNVSYAFVLGGKAPKEPVFNTNIADVGITYHKFSLGYIYNF